MQAQVVVQVALVEALLTVEVVQVELVQEQRLIQRQEHQVQVDL